MPKIQHEQALTDWAGDTASLVAEMKRRAGVRTDRDLASFLGVAQSTVSHWRARDVVPESAVLRFERLLVAGGEPVTMRALAARMIALRVAEFWYLRARAAGAKGGREIFYGSVAGSFHTITDAIYEQLQKYERESGLSPWEIAGRLVDDDTFVGQIVDWAKEISFAEGLAREALNPPSVKVPQ